MSETLNILAQLGMLIFVLATMLGTGLSLTVPQILAPLRDWVLILKALLVNFIFVPLVAYLLVIVFDLDEPIAIGLMVLATAAGAPFIPKLVQMAKGNLAFAVGLTVLLMVVTVLYVPIVLPLLLPKVEIDSWAIAKSLVTTMLLPLAIGLFIRARYPETAESLRPLMQQASSYSLMVVLVLGLYLTFPDLLAAIGTGAFLASGLFIAISFFLGYLLGGPGADTKRVLALGSAQRNVAAALVVGMGNFKDPAVFVMILICALMILVSLTIIAGEFGKRAEAAAAAGDE